MTIKLSQDEYIAAFMPQVRGRGVRYIEVYIGDLVTGEIRIARLLASQFSREQHALFNICDTVVKTFLYTIKTTETQKEKSL